MRVCVVGCGIAGGYTALRLSREGHEITVLERKAVIGKQVCSGLISQRVWEYVPYNEELVENRANEIILHFPQRDIRLQLLPEMYVVSHKHLDQYVAKLAVEAGATIRTETIVEKIADGNKVIVQTKHKDNIETEEFDVLIGADGPMSTVRKEVGIADPTFRLGIQGFEEKSDNSKAIDVWPTQTGFFWRIPRGNEVEYGIFDDVENASKQFAEFSKEHNLKLRLQSYLIPVGITKASKGNVALVGDAIGLTKPWSGGGILWSLTCAEILVKNFPDLKRYENALHRFFDPVIMKSRFAARIGTFLGYNAPAIVPKKLKFDADWFF